MKKKSNTITLYTYETNRTRSMEYWDEIKCFEGVGVDRYPSETYQSFISYKKAKKAAKDEANLFLSKQEWYFVIAFEVNAKIVSRLFDAHYGADDEPRCTIKKVYPIKFVGPVEHKEEEENEEQEEENNEEYEEEIKI